MADSWDDIRRIADEVRLKLHLAGMDARDRLRALEPVFAELDKVLVKVGQSASAAIDEELSSIGAAMRRLRDDLAARP